MPIKTEDFDEDDPLESGISVLLKFTLTAKYPEEAPLVEIEEQSESLDDDVAKEFMEHLKEQVRVFSADSFYLDIFFSF